MGLLLRLVLLFSLPLAAHSAGSKVHEYTLENGLKILVKEDHRAPVVISQVWYKVGASHEYSGITGISHMLEHMMFKGTKQLKPGQFSRIIAENGGQENAFTGRDYTGYYQRLEKSRLPVSFKLEADRMRNLILLEAEFKKENQVVLEERRMRTDDKPRSKLYEHFMSLAYSNSPYQNPIIGWPEDIEQLTLVELQAWYSRWYAPNNATVVVAGDVNPADVLALAKRHFGPLKPSTLITQKPRLEVKQLGQRRMSIRLPAKLPYLIMGYKVPVLNTVELEWEAYALEVLAGILDGGSSARLASRLVRGQQIAVSAGAGYDLYARLPTLFMLDATPVQGQPMLSVEIALKDEIKNLQAQLVSNDELERIKAQVLANAIYERDSVFYQAMQLGQLETTGLGWRIADEYVDKVQSVTAEQIQAVAKKYLIDDHLSVANLEPLPITQSSQAASTVSGGRHAH